MMPHGNLRHDDSTYILQMWIVSLWWGFRDVV